MKGKPEMSFKQYIIEAGMQAERQEMGFINLVKKTLISNKNQPIIIYTNHGDSIKDVIGISKFSGRSVGGAEPLTDVVLKIKNKQDVRISMKGTSAPSLAGGGLSGIEATIPGISSKFMHAAHAYLSKKYKTGDKIPDVYTKIDDKHKKLLLKGNAAVGGPIDYMYIGGMDVDGTIKNGKLTINNAKLVHVDEYSKNNDFYFRLRARREDQTFDKTAKFPNGTPKIYGKSAKGDSAGRIVVVNKVPGNAVVI
jgi:hypothetical protein